MDNKIVGLDGSVFTPPPSSSDGKPAPVEVLVELCERLLADAKTGAIQSLVGTGVTAEGDVFTVLLDDALNGRQRYMMVGAVSILKTVYMESVLMDTISTPPDDPALDGDAT